MLVHPQIDHDELPERKFTSDARKTPPEQIRSASEVPPLTFPGIEIMPWYISPVTTSSPPASHTKPVPPPAKETSSAKTEPPTIVTVPTELDNSPTPRPLVRKMPFEIIKLPAPR